MINRIEIENYATIEHMSFDLGEHLNIITGETGAGKSVLITAISTVLGGRADTAMVRTGAAKAIIRLAGDKDGEEVIISREISPSGKSLSKLNGEMITLANLRKFCDDWIDIHGQYDNQQILDPENHIHITDRFHSESIAPELEKLGELYNDYKAAQRNYDELLRAEATAAQQQDYYKFEFNYINGLNLKPGEDDALKEQLAMIKNSAGIYSAVMTSYNLLHEDESSVLTSLNRVNNALSSVSSYGENLSNLSEQASDAYYALEDVSERLRAIADSLDFSEEDIDKIQERLSVIEDAIRKYHRNIDGILEYKTELENKLNIIENFDAEKSRLAEIAHNAYKDLEFQANHVSEIRHIIAARLESAMKNELKDLDFANSDFGIRIDKLPEIGPLGFDSVEFLISTNPGEPLMPLTRIASGGEISRIMLAFKHIIGESENVETMIFDEIDTGISGRTALTVGKKMRELAQFRQIISVTHLPQIAAYGDDNYLITKSISEEKSQGMKSHTNIDHLDSSGKVKMLATLFSGSDDSDSAITAAEELIARTSK